jgi:hypothetical protein
VRRTVPRPADQDRFHSTKASLPDHLAPLLHRIPARRLTAEARAADGITGGLKCKKFRGPAFTKQMFLASKGENHEVRQLPLRSTLRVRDQHLQVL